MKKSEKNLIKEIFEEIRKTLDEMKRTLDELQRLEDRDRKLLIKQMGMLNK